MTRRQDQLRQRSRDDLLTAVERGDESASEVLGEIQRLREAGRSPDTYVIMHSAHHGWRLNDLTRYSFVFCQRENERVCVAIEHFEPGTAPLGHGSMIGRKR